MGKFQGRNSVLKKHILTGALVLLLPVTVLAQTNATVGGTVGDAAGAVIPGVEVTAKNVNTGIVSSQLTNETGTYNFASLQPGTYTFSASLPGFQTQTFQNVTLSQSQQVRLNFTLAVATCFPMSKFETCRWPSATFFN